ncbi:hypothetical protein [Clostridium sp. ZS2-4]|uniref:hypothetical protein n=1 Tax=Clostridium sp. ZS2-4 TaxID=2987703 RepID=UPI00227C70BC|nr:hypothetical protein [Clostridium sp. ZS2-4]MCY6356114.1 hypothetical protein [Clostridium sp. ZS2-4]
MNIYIDSDNMQPVLVVGIDKEKSSFHNMVFKVEEIEEGIVSYLTIKEIEELIKVLIPNISQEQYNSLVKSSTPLLYLIYDIQELSLFLACSEVIENVKNYKKMEKNILQRAATDFSILI